jgi:hypothetical protein
MYSDEGKTLSSRAAARRCLIFPLILLISFDLRKSGIRNRPGAMSTVNPTNPTFSGRLMQSTDSAELVNGRSPLFDFSFDPF